MQKFIFVTGGVVSSLGKGIAAASLGALLKARGYKVNIKKLDPYLNVDPGTMSPTQHGEVFVTEDGAEADLDLGHYERFLEQHTTANSNVTSGKLYQSLLENERSGKYLGETVQVVPHFVNLVQEFIDRDKSKFDFTICEIGGTIGDIEGVAFLEGVRQFSRKINLKNIVFIHVTLLPYIRVAQELKTKPTQHSVKTLMSLGIEPDIILCRTEMPINKQIRKKISMFCNVEECNVINAPDLDSVYQAPTKYAENGLDTRVLSILGINSEVDKKYLLKWENFVKKMQNINKTIKIAIIGKYDTNADQYKSLVEAINHACIANNLKLDLSILSSDNIDKSNVANKLKPFKAIVVAAGFGKTQIEGKIEAIKYIRENKIPFLGICFGMQLAVIEYFRNVLNVKNANSTEINPSVANTEACIVGIIKKWKDEENKDLINTKSTSQFDGKMHLGASKVTIANNSIAKEIYKSNTISERHRHRYQIIEAKQEEFAKTGGVFSGRSATLNLPEIFELQRSNKYPQSHPFFIGVQYHPEFKSNPFKPHPLFTKLIEEGAKTKL
ncbi:MAG: CTP synthase [Alphaproteobacteria bacterium]|nr:CTP synthase [Rickettsiales bacterium]